MENNIQDIIKQRLNELPVEIKEAIKSTDLASKFESIATKHSLRIDQNGALQTETLLVMLGLESSDDFMDNIEKELDISRSQALALAEEVNKEILGGIKDAIRRAERQELVISETPTVVPVPPPQPSTPPPPIAPIEKAGGFTIESSQPSHSPLYNDSNLKREEVLNDLENINNLHPDNAEKFVEHLIESPAPAPQPEQKRTGNDPYREAI